MLGTDPDGAPWAAGFPDRERRASGDATLRLTSRGEVNQVLIAGSESAVVLVGNGDVFSHAEPYTVPPRLASRRPLSPSAAMRHHASAATRSAVLTTDIHPPHHPTKEGTVANQNNQEIRDLARLFEDKFAQMEDRFSKMEERLEMAGHALAGNTDYFLEHFPARTRSPGGGVRRDRGEAADRGPGRRHARQDRHREGLERVPRPLVSPGGWGHSRI